MSKILLKILKSALLPAALMIMGKVLGLYISIKVFGLSLYIDNEIQKLFTIQFYFLDSTETIAANTYADGFMMLLMFLGVGYFAVKYFVKLKSEEDPKTIIKLLDLNLLNWITAPGNIVIPLLTWATFVCFANLIVLKNTLQGLNSAWLGVISVISLIVIVWGVVCVITTELKKAKHGEYKNYY